MRSALPPYKAFVEVAAERLATLSPATVSMCTLAPEKGTKGKEDEMKSNRRGRCEAAPATVYACTPARKKNERERKDADD